MDGGNDKQSSDSLAERFRVVLVHPEQSLNIGSVARAMKNLGFRHLVLVAPAQFDRAKAAITACWATDLLDSASIVSTLDEAIAECQSVVGFSARVGRDRGEPQLLYRWADELRTRPAMSTALVFGPEATGLQNEELERCGVVVRIPSAAECPAYNLAQAVLVSLYELRRGEALGVASNPEPADLPPMSEFEALSRLLTSTMELSGFERQGTPEPVPALVRNFFRKIQPNKREMGVLLGLFGRIQTTLRRAGIT